MFSIIKMMGKSISIVLLPKKITLEQALIEIDNLPTEKEVGTANFIGFIKNEIETIQFVRFEKDDWLLDVPILEKGTYLYSMQDDNLKTKEDKEIVRKFFSNEDWKPLCNLSRV